MEPPGHFLRIAKVIGIAIFFMEKIENPTIMNSTEKSKAGDSKSRHNGPFYENRLAFRGKGPMGRARSH